MITIENARAIVYGLDPENVARQVWRASVDAEEDMDAGMVLDLDTGEVFTVIWTSGEKTWLHKECVMIAWIRAQHRLLTRAVFTPQESAVPASEEQIEEDVARYGWRNITWLSNDHWQLIEKQLDFNYRREAA